VVFSYLELPILQNELALLLAERGVAARRNQGLQYEGIEFIKRFGEHSGPLHIHSLCGAP
jgi:hypothetical protein